MITETKPIWLPDRHGYQKVCPVCEKEFVGRRNQRFCCHPCKNKYHYDRNAERLARTRQLTMEMDHNIRLLEKKFSSSDSERVVMPYAQLLKLGFDQNAPCQKSQENGLNYFIYGNWALRIIREENKDAQVEITKT